MVTPPQLRRSAPIRAASRSVRLWCAGATVLLAGCEWGGPTYFLAKYDREIKDSTQAIETARNDAQRAQAHSARASAYSEKARYSRASKLISPEEYGRLFDLAVKDHDRAVELAPGEPGVYLARGLTFYNRAAYDDHPDAITAAAFDAARADFTRTLERDRHNGQAYDMRGLVGIAIGDLDGAIADFTDLERLDRRLGESRLADAHCRRGDSYVKAKSYERAIADYEKAIELGAPSDGCDCQPDTPLAWTYCELRQYDKSWEVVHRAQRAHRWIMPELIERLKKASGRDR